MCKGYTVQTHRRQNALQKSARGGDKVRGQHRTGRHHHTRPRQPEATSRLSTQVACACRQVHAHAEGGQTMHNSAHLNQWQLRHVAICGAYMRRRVAGASPVRTVPHVRRAGGPSAGQRSDQPIINVDIPVTACQNSHGNSYRRHHLLELPARTHTMYQLKVYISHPATWS